jgi:hypothetical protein
MVGKSQQKGKVEMNTALRIAKELAADISDGKVLRNNEFYTDAWFNEYARRLLAAHEDRGDPMVRITDLLADWDRIARPIDSKWAALQARKMLAEDTLKSDSPIAHLEVPTPRTLAVRGSVECTDDSFEYRARLAQAYYELARQLELELAAAPALLIALKRMVQLDNDVTKGAPYWYEAWAAARIAAKNAIDAVAQKKQTMKNAKKQPLVVLKSLKTGKCFCSATFNGEFDHDYSKLADGTVAYEVVGFFDNDEQVHNVMDKINGPFHLYDYIVKTSKEMEERGMGAFDPNPLFDLVKKPTDQKR